MVRQVKIQVTLQVEQKSTIPISDKVGPFWYMYYTAFGTTQLLVTLKHLPQLKS